MADEASRKAVKRGVGLGGGPPPGYLWNVEILDAAWDEAMSFLDRSQYDHLARQFRVLASQEDPSHSPTVDVRPIEDFHELRDKGGILKRLNVRIFFFIHKPRRSIVVLAAINKKNDGPTPLGDKVRARARKRRYLEGFVGRGAT